MDYALYKKCPLSGTSDPTPCYLEVRVDPPTDTKNSTGIYLPGSLGLDYMS